MCSSPKIQAAPEPAPPPAPVPPQVSPMQAAPAAAGSEDTGSGRKRVGGISQLRISNRSGGL